MTTPPTTLHERIAAELDRRTAVANSADGADWTLVERAEYGPKVGEWMREVNHQVWHCDDEQDGCPDAARGWIAEARHIALHDPADALRRYAGELEVLERHALSTDASQHIFCEPDCQGGDCTWCKISYPCPDLLSLASRLGVSVDG